jgi:hypothetical protein
VEADAGTCAGFASPSEASCCRSCTPGSGNCQSNGCYGGWWCDTATCRCHSPPTSCGPSGLDGGLPHSDGGTPQDAGLPPPDAGTIEDGGVPTGSIGPNGGSVSRLYFAVIGDTRPGGIDATSSYPTAIIQKIYADVEALNPRPQFVLTTGDYMFASPTGTQAQIQIGYYMSAAREFSGTIFSVMGNHECTGGTTSNCASQTTNNYTAFMNALVTPLGKSKPYYSVPINATDGSWTAKLILVACNAWDATQRSWLQSELARPTTYTFVSRHEPTAVSGLPCGSDMSTLLSQYPYDLLIVGHTHTFAHYTKEIVVGNGGAPLTGTVNYGFVTVEQLAQGGFKITLYDYMTAMPVSSFTVP